MLGMLEPFDVAKLGANSAAKYHLFIEVMRRAFRDRAEFLGDPDFVNVPTAGLLDRAYLAGLMKNFDPAKATPSDGLAPGQPAGWKLLTALGSRLNAAESTETTHYSIVDAAGNAVSNTYTLNGGFGSGVTIPGTGILMNNEMDDFTSKIGVKNMFGLLQGPANAIAPGKRPLSSMTLNINIFINNYWELSLNIIIKMEHLVFDSFTLRKFLIKIYYLLIFDACFLCLIFLSLFCWK